MSYEFLKQYKGDKLFRCSFHKLDDNNVVSDIDYCMIKSNSALSCYCLIQFASTRGYFSNWILDSISEVIPADLQDLKTQFAKLDKPF